MKKEEGKLKFKDKLSNRLPSFMLSDSDEWLTDASLTKSGRFLVDIESLRKDTAPMLKL